MTITSREERLERSPGPSLSGDSEHINYAKVVILGAAGTGKTALIRRFMSNVFDPQHVPTVTRSDYFPSLVYDCSIVECRVVDIPVIENFPTTTEDEWTRYPNYGLRNADAYVLVYDVNSPASFSFIQLIRDQIAMSRGLTDVPMIVVGNKTDLLRRDLASDKFRHDVINKVKKSWKLHHVEVSAKYNWNVTAAFRDLSIEILAVRSRAMDCSSGGSRETCCISCIV